MNLIDNKKIRNWGYIDDNDNNKNNKNSIQTNNKYILIGIDCGGLNRPVRVHVKRDLLLDALINTKQICTISIYDGKYDFYNNYEFLPTHVVLPLEKRHKDFLRKQSTVENNNYKYPILSHTTFLANQDKFPEHLKVKKGLLYSINSIENISISRGFLSISIPSLAKLYNGTPSCFKAEYIGGIC